MSGEEWHEYQDEDDEDLCPGFDIDSNEYYYDGFLDSGARVFRVKIDHEKGRLIVEFGPGYMSTSYEENGNHLSMLKPYDGWQKAIDKHIQDMIWDD